MSSDAVALRTRIAARFDELGVAASDAEIQQLTDYFWLLAKWTRRINLTALPVAEATSAAIDRLLVEPIVASRLALPTDELAIDLGSGGGSPAFPLKIGAPHLRMVLVESRERKCAFLREVARSLAVTDVEVANTRFEQFKFRADAASQADLVSFRAVRADDSLWATTEALLKLGGRAFWFGGPAMPGTNSQGKDIGLGFGGLGLASSHILIPTDGGFAPSRLAVLQKPI